VKTTTGAGGQVGAGQGQHTVAEINLICVRQGQ